MSKTKDAAAKKNQITLVITGVLIFVFIVTFTKNVILRKKGPAPASTSAPAATPPDSTGLADQLIFATRLRSSDNLKADQLKVWDKEWARDPFIPPVTFSTITKAVNLTLQGIFWDEAKPKAIVNDKTLYNGDSIYGYTVVEIKTRSVILRTGEKNIELSVFHPVPVES